MFAGFDVDATSFSQDRNFYYLTKINEPGVVLLLELSGKSTLYVPSGLEKRMQWTPVQTELGSVDFS